MTLCLKRTNGAPRAKFSESKSIENLTPPRGGRGALGQPEQSFKSIDTVNDAKLFLVGIQEIRFFPGGYFSTEKQRRVGGRVGFYSRWKRTERIFFYSRSEFDTILTTLLGGWWVTPDELITSAATGEARAKTRASATRSWQGKGARAA